MGDGMLESTGDVDRFWRLACYGRNLQSSIGGPAGGRLSGKPTSQECCDSLQGAKIAPCEAVGMPRSGPWFGDSRGMRRSRCRDIAGRRRRVEELIEIDAMGFGLASDVVVVTPLVSPEPSSQD